MKKILIFIILAFVTGVTFGTNCDPAGNVQASPPTIAINTNTTATVTLLNIGTDPNCIIPIGGLRGVLSLSPQVEFVEIVVPVGGFQYFTVTYDPDEHVVIMQNFAPVPNVIYGGSEQIDIIVKGIVLGSTQLIFNIENPLGIDNNVGNDYNTTVINITAPLPIKLGDFSAKVDDCSAVDILWDTYSEENFDRAEIQKSVDGKNFKTIGTVKSKGNGISVHNSYVFTDRSPLVSGTAYYRLKAIDIDNAFSYSKLATANVDCDGVLDMNIYPNPTQGTANVTFKGFKNKSECNVILLNVKGEVVKDYKMDPLTNNFLNVDDLPSGVYFLKLIDDSVSLQKKFVKIN